MLMEIFKKELDRMLSLNVIEKVNEPSDWLKRKINLDQAIKLCHYSLPNVEDMRHKLANAKYFSTLDAQARFWMIKLDKIRVPI